MEQSGTAFSSDNVKRQSLLNNLHNAERDYELAQAKLEEYRTEQAKLVKSSDDVEEAVENVAQASDKAAAKVKKSGRGFSVLFEPAIKNFNRGNQFIKRMLSSLSRLGKRGSDSIKKINGSARDGIHTFMKYAISIGGLFAVLKKLQTTIAKSYKNLAQYSDEVNNSVSSVLSAFSKLENSLAAAVQPIERVVSPILSVLIDKLSRAALAAGQFFAALTGQDFVYKALDTQEDYAGSLKDTAESAEEAKKALNGYLSPLDEINRYTSDKDKNNDPTTNTGPAFEVTPIEQSFKNLADKIKDYFGDFFEPFRASWDNKGSAVVKAWREALERVKGTLADIAEDFKSVWTNGSGEKLLDKLLESFELLGEGVDAFVGAFQDAWNKNDLGESVIQSMIDHATALLDLINAIGRDLIDVWNAGRGERIWSNILKIVKNINEILGGFYVKLKKAWDKNEKGKKIWETILNIIEEVTDFFRELSEITVEWVDDLDFNPLLEGILSLLEGFKKLLKVLNGKFKTVYEKILLPLAKWTIEKAVPKLLEAMGNALEFIADVIDDIPESVLIGLASAIAGLGTAVLVFKGGQAIASGISAVAGAMKLFLSTVAAHPILVLAGAIAGVTAAIIAYNELQWGNTGITKLIGEFEQYNDSMLQISQNITDMASKSEKTLSEAFADTSLVENYRKRLGELLADAKIDPDEEAEFKIITDYFREKFPEFDTIINDYMKKSDDGKVEIVGDLAEMETKLDSLIDKYKRLSISSAYSSLADDSYKAQIQNRRNYNELVAENKELFDAYDRYESVVGELRSYRSEFIEAWNNNDKERFDSLQKILSEKGQALVDQANEAAKVFEKYGVVVENLEKVNNDLIEANQYTYEGIFGSYHKDTGLENMYRLLDELVPVVQSAKEAQEAANASLQEGEELTARYQQAQIYLADGIKDNYLGALELYEQGFITADEVMNNLGLTVEELEKKAGEQGLTGTLAKSTDSINADMDSIESSTGKAAEAISDLETETETPLSNTEDNIESLATTTETSMSNVVNAITTAVQDSIKRLRELQEEAEKTGDKVSPIGAAGGALAGVAALQSTLVQRKQTIPNIVNAPSIPKLAQGAVIPPNNEFLAILGDQKRGRNFETPESTLRQLIREELGNFGGSDGKYQFTATLDGRVLFDKIIDRAKLKQTLTGKNPFELV